MGALIYGPGAARIDVDDHLLAHLQFVITNKLRRRESFTVGFTATSERSRCSIWLNDAIPLIFEYDSNDRPSRDRSHVEAMMVETIAAAGLQIDTWPPEGSRLALVD